MPTGWAHLDLDDPLDAAYQFLGLVQANRYCQSQVFGNAIPELIVLARSRTKLLFATRTFLGAPSGPAR